MTAKRPKRKNTMEYVVKMRISSANFAKPQREEHFYRAPCKTATNTRVEKTNLVTSVTPETEKYYGTRCENENFECQHCKAAASRTLL